MSKRWADPWLLLLLLALLARMATLGAYPLMDTTEARYAEVARLMLESGNWVTPYIDYGVPFWGKPPLSFWLSASSFALLGVNEFAARLPSLLCGFACLLLMIVPCRALGIRNVALPLTLCATSLVFFVSSGAVMTEASLLLAVTLSLVSAIQVLLSNGDTRLWQYLFFVGLALGMLAKGPVAVVLSGTPLLLWAFLHGGLDTLWRAFPWIRGTLLFFLISAPWYLLAEYRTPGFLEYFFIGEHFQRFIVPGWEGDLYGSGHHRARGTIWLYWLLGAFPLSTFALAAFGTRVLRTRSAPKNHRNFLSVDFFLLYFSITPLVFFTLASNILWAYIAPGIPALALLLARHWPFASCKRSGTRTLSLYGIAAMVPMLFPILAGLIQINPHLVKSEKFMIQAAREQFPDLPVFYLGGTEFSARFYSGGAARAWNPTEHENRLPAMAVLAVRKDQNQDLQTLLEDFRPVYSNLRYYLYRSNSPQLETKETLEADWTEPASYQQAWQNIADPPDPADVGLAAQKLQYR
ncbi:ArnT family glycosyltransferase [Congregibacter sp.]|uniref:ArnT family glycosyltransferase n=1 Tax=Congregibacter sp. TaxID=2744308 RepID=UPI003F6C522F